MPVDVDIGPPHESCSTPREQAIENSQPVSNGSTPNKRLRTWLFSYDRFVEESFNSEPEVRLTLILSRKVIEIAMARNVADVLWEMLVKAGVKRCYGIVGDALNPVIDALRRNGNVDFVHVRNEETASSPRSQMLTSQARPSPCAEQRDLASSISSTA